MAKIKNVLFIAVILLMYGFMFPVLADDRNLSKDDIERLRASAESGNPIDQTRLGTLYLYGWSLEKNEVEAVKWLYKAADQGQPLAEYDMGVIFRMGIGGVTKNDAEAVKWWLKSAEQGNVLAQGDLTLAYHVGFGGLTKDDVQAYMWNSLYIAHTDEALQPKLTHTRDMLEQSMTADQIAEAKRLTKEWVQQHPDVK